MNRKLIILASLLLGLTILRAVDISDLARVVTPPKAKRTDYYERVNNHYIRDPYHWLKDKSRTNEGVISYIEQENIYTSKIMEPTVDNQDKLYKEMISRMNEDDLSLPVQRDCYFYYMREEAGKDYSIYCRRKDSMESPEEIIIDINKLAKGHDYFSLDVIAVSPNHKLVAYAYDSTGEEIYDLVVLNIANGKILPDTLSSISSVEWSNDSKYIYYTKDNQIENYTDSLYRHRLGDKQEDDALLLKEDDAKYLVWLYKTKDKSYLIAGSSSKITDEIYYADANAINPSFKLLRQRISGIQYSLSHKDGLFYILTNDNAPNYRLMTVESDNPDYENWKELVREDSSIFLDYFELFDRFMVLNEIIDGKMMMKIHDFISNEKYYIDFDDPAYTYYTHGNPDFFTTSLRYSYESLTTPEIAYQYDLLTKSRKVLKKREIPSGYDQNNYESEKIYAKADDGTLIPISLVYNKQLFKKNGSNPLYLEGYGAYGTISEPYFSSSRLSLLDRGFVYAIAHIRGGGENGDSWYNAGRLLNKKNTFNDFIACCDYLVKTNYTSRKKLVIDGGSAGGLLIGAVLNQRPDISEIAIAEVPFVDIINTMLDTTLVATVAEYEEWGNPGEDKYFDYMSSYCPYTNVRTSNYPHMLVIAGFYDPRVNYWEPAKWVAKLRYMKTDKNVLLLRTNMSGHQGASGRYQYFEELAFQYAFIMNILGIDL